MTTAITQFDVAFTKLSFTRSGNNLIVSNGSTVLATYENFFNGNEMGTVTTIQTKDTKSGAYTTHNLLDEATIIVPNVAEYQGYNVKLDDSTYIGYNEEVVVKYDGIKYVPVGQTVGYDSVIYGNYGDDIIFGSTKDDWLQGSQGNDSIFGGSDGEDMISGDMGDDTIIAGAVKSDGKINYNKTGIQLYGADGNDVIIGGKGNDFIWAGTGNDAMAGNGGKNTFMFVEDNFGNDVVSDSNAEDTLKFVVNNGSSSEPDYSGFKFSDLTFIKNGNDLVITTPASLNSVNFVENSVTLRKYFSKSSAKRIDSVYALNENGESEAYSIMKNANIQVNIDGSTRKYKSGDDDETIIASGYVSENGKTGVSITTGSGNNTIIGSNYNDTIKTGNGLNNITENEGTNKITTGKGIDIIMVNNYSSNKIKSSGGDNEIYLNSYASNKVTTGSGNDEAVITNGYNTLKLGNGNNRVYVYDESFNKITTGRNNDSFTIIAGANTIKSGGGVDYFSINDGYNIIDSGSGDSVYTITGGIQNTLSGGKNVDSFTINNGVNYVDAKSGDDVFYISGGDNILKGGKGNDTFNVSDGNNNIDGGKGNDIYDFEEFVDILTDGNVNITDNSGKNSIIFNQTDYTTSDVSLYVDVTLNSKNKAVINGNWNITSRDNTDNVVEGISLTGGKKSITNIVIDNITYTVNKSVLNEIASSVATWLSANNYTSTTDVFDSGIATDVSELIGVYNTASSNFFNEPVQS